MTPSAIVTDELGSIDLILRDRGIEAEHLRVPTCRFRHVLVTAGCDCSSLLKLPFFWGGNCGQIPAFVNLYSILVFVGFFF